MSNTNWSNQIADYRGVLNYPAVIDGVTTGGYPGLAIELFIKEMPVPVRKQKVTEMNMLGTANGSFLFDTSFSAAFYGTPDPLILNFSGFLITPMNSGRWYIPEWDVYDFSYADAISAYVEGRLKRDITRRGRRVDPDTFVDPYGNVYYYPKVTTYEFAYTVSPKKQTFTLGLWLEQ